MKVPVYNLKNEKVSEADLPESFFGVRWNPDLIRQMLLAQLANKRRPWAHVKTRGEVRGGGKKPWRQKGTGRARHGSTRSPIWVGGGVSHGPRNERDYSQKVNVKMRQAALRVALSKKLKDNELKVLASFEVESPKTKLLASSLKAILDLKKGEKRYDALLVAEKRNKNIARASSNLPKTKAVRPESMNIYDVLNHKHVLIDERSVAELIKHYARA